jgi:hypothetical protein
MFAALYIVNVLVGRLKGNWTLVMRGLPMDNFRTILRKLYQQIKLTLPVCRTREDFRNQHTFPIQQHLYLSLVLFWKYVFIPRLLNSVLGMCINKLKFAISLGSHISAIYVQPVTFIILFEELGLKSSHVLGKLRFFWDDSQILKYIAILQTVMSLCFPPQFFQHLIYSCLFNFQLSFFSRRVLRWTRST